MKNEYRRWDTFMKMMPFVARRELNHVVLHDFA